MPKKQQRNGFYFYMQDLMPELRREGRVFPNGMADVVPVAHPRWKALPEKDKSRYEQMAKEWKAKMRGAEGDKYRLDNVGNLLSERKDERKEYDADRMKERKQVRTKWPTGDGVIHEKFYFINFQYQCQIEESYFIPVEVGLIEYSLHDGITKHLHRMIEPGPIPTGYRYTCQNHSEETHQIPIERFEYADKNYMGLWIQMENFLNPNQERKESPPIYCQKSDWKCVVSCLDWLHAHACLGYANRLRKVYELDGLVQDLFSQASSAIALSECTDLITTSAFDYEMNTRCDYHEDKEIKHCALGIVRRYAYAISDSLSSVYNFELSANHLPTRPDNLPAYTMIEPAAVKVNLMNTGRNKNSQSPNRRGVGRGRGSSVENSTFPAKDFRLNQKESEPAQQQNIEPAQTIRRPNIPGVAAQASFPPAPRQAPWAAKPAADQSPAWPQLGKGPQASVLAPHPLQQRAAPAPWVQKAATQLPSGAQSAPTAAFPPRNPSFHGNLQDVEEFPSLGGPPPGTAPSQAPKFAGRTPAAPPAQDAPKPPATWSSQVQYPSANFQSSNTMNQSFQAGPQGVAQLQGSLGVAQPQGSLGVAQLQGSLGVTQPQGPQGVVSQPQGPQGVVSQPQGPQGVISQPQGPQGVISQPQGPQGVISQPRPAWGSGSQAGSPSRGVARGRGLYNPGASRPPPGFANPPVGHGTPCAMAGRGYAVPPGMGRGLLVQPLHTVRPAVPNPQRDVAVGMANLDLDADENWG